MGIFTRILTLIREGCSCYTRYGTETDVAILSSLGWTLVAQYCTGVQLMSDDQSLSSPGTQFKRAICTSLRYFTELLVYASSVCPNPRDFEAMP